MNDLISRQDAIEAVHRNFDTILDFKSDGRTVASCFEDIINALPSAQSEVIQCKDCKYWKQSKTYQGTPLPFGFCKNNYMWTETDDNFYCGYAERRTDE